MNSLQRVLAAIEGKEADRRAWAPLLSLYGARLTRCPLDVYYSDPSEYARGQTAVLETFGVDALIGPFAFPLEGKAFGSDVEVFRDHPPFLKAPVLAEAMGIRNLNIPDPDYHPILLYFREAVRLMIQQHGKSVPILPVALSPIDLPAMLLGIEGWLETLLFSPDHARRIMNFTVPFFIRWANALFEDGAFAIITPTSFANSSILTRELAAELTIPPLREAFSQVNGTLIIHSSGTNINPFIDLFAELPKVSAIIVNSRDSFDEARQKVGSTFTLLGNIDGPSVQKKTQDFVKEKCREIIDNRRDDPYFILASSGPEIPYETPVENITAMRQALNLVDDKMPSVGKDNVN